MGWYKDASGKPVWVADAAPQGVPIGPQDPAMASRAPQADANVRKTNADIQNDRTRLNQEQERLRLAQEQAARADMMAGKSAQATQFAQQVANRPLQDKSAALDNLSGIVSDLRNQYNQNFKGQPASRWFGAKELIPGSVMGIPINPTNQKFNSTGLRAGPFIQSILGLGGKDTDAAAEYERKVMPFIPKANDSDEVIASKINQLQEFLTRQRGNVNAQLGVKARPSGMIGSSSRNPPRKPAKSAGAKFLGFEN